MNKQVYLFELDSVRKRNEEIVLGQKALYDEIVVNGNTVVLTYNQLVDSRAMFSLLQDREYYDSLISLCEDGRIRVSQFGDLRTISQYLLNTIEEDKQFIYSALPLKFSQKRLTALMRRSLTYSDLSEIYSYFSGEARSEDELRDLFVEVIDGELVQSELNVTQMRDILKNLYWLLSTVLRLSTLHEMYVPPKDPKEYEYLRLHHILAAAIRLPSDDDALWDSAVEIIKALPCLQNDNRSVYLREIRRAGRNSRDLTAYRYAEAIVNLCYNYACENSICNISKHYNVDELADPDGEKPTFRRDFFLRLSKDWRNGDCAGERYLTEETNRFETYVKSDRYPSLSQAVRLTRYEDRTDSRETTDPSGVLRYEYQMEAQRKSHRRIVMRAIGEKLFGSAFCIFFACIIALAFQFIQDSVDLHSLGRIVGNYSNLVYSVVETILFLFISEIVTSILNRVFPGLLSLGEALSGFGMLLLDGVKVLHSRTSAHFNPCREGVEFREKASRGVQIDFIVSSELRAYAKYRDRNQNADASRFRQSDICPIADTNDPVVLKKLMRLEELFHFRFGIAYRSRYNTMVVDPIEGGRNGFYPYERILPSSGTNGVVMIAEHDGRYIVLKQYRHALRKEQLAFPRGFAEPDETPEASVIRELREELNAVIASPPVFVGTLAPDSGLSGVAAQVYRVEVEDYDVAAGHEGILEAVEIPSDRFGDWIRRGNTDDGFTMGAYSLLAGS